MQARWPLVCGRWGFSCCVGGRGWDVPGLAGVRSSGRNGWRVAERLERRLLLIGHCGAAPGVRSAASRGSGAGRGPVGALPVLVGRCPCSWGRVLVGALPVLVGALPVLVGARARGGAARARGARARGGAARARGGACSWGRCNCTNAPVSEGGCAGAYRFGTQIPPNAPQRPEACDVLAPRTSPTPAPRLGLRACGRDRTPANAGPIPGWPAQPALESRCCGPLGPGHLLPARSRKRRLRSPQAPATPASPVLERPQLPSPRAPGTPPGQCPQAQQQRAARLIPASDHLGTAERPPADRAGARRTSYMLARRPASALERGTCAGPTRSASISSTIRRRAAPGPAGRLRVPVVRTRIRSPRR